MLIGSSLQPVVTILDADLKVVREFGANGGREQVMFAHRFEKAGVYYVRVADYQHSGRAGHFYRIVAGEFPLVTGAYPLGVRKGAGGEVALRGYPRAREGEGRRQGRAGFRRHADAAAGARVQPGARGAWRGAGDRFAGRSDSGPGDDQRPDRRSRARRIATASRRGRASSWCSK